MPKRKREESKEERWSRKMKKYEAKLLKTQCRNTKRIVYSSDEDDVHIEEHPVPGETELFNVGNISSEQQEIFSDLDSYQDLPPKEVPLTVTENNEEVAECIDSELLQALGENESEITEYGDEIYKDIATRFPKILIEGLRKENREELIKKYLFPKNLPFLKAPTLNPEVHAMLPEPCRLRDKRLICKQDQLGRALSALGKAMTALLKKDPVISEVIRILSDTGKLIADSHYAETDTRRSVIIPLVDKSLADTFKNRKRDTFLFGESLSEVVKESRGIKKTSQLIQATASSSSSGLNFRGPSARPRQCASQTNSQQRAGGHKTSYANRRRVVAAPAPHSRRPQPPPPPPARRQPVYKPRPAADRSRN
ncbi:uncharacterized protein LOC113519792 [Galleria mellonella]|uniref:Uncharacterized protein LOC113519792 n=1 Tax=Galleria mellonella TaxID=7137 RepID=A0ABM3MME3_GALME|nr:uncharacterized protein LOC113519792 [Galleria mellonella]